MENIFLADKKPISLGEYHSMLRTAAAIWEMSFRSVYRMLEYSMKDELIRRFGKETQIDIFRQAGKKAGEYFAKQFLDISLPLDQFAGSLQRKLQELKIGVLRIEDVNEETGKIIFDRFGGCGLFRASVLGETVCNYDEGFISGILSLYSGKTYEAIEVDCWATGDRVCRFHSGD